MTAVHRRRQAALAGVALLALIVIVALARGCGSSTSTVRPFAYSTKHEHTLAARAADGVAHGLYVNSPGGVVATAARVAQFRGDVVQAARRGNVDPDALEGILFLESGGYPEAMAAGDPSAATGLTQILPDTATSLLKMHVDLAASKRLTAAIAKAARRGEDAKIVHLKAERRQADDRFVPAKELAGTVRYLVYAGNHLHRDDLALASYHMGIGNLQNVLAAYGSTDVSYPTLFFHSAPDEHSAAWAKLSSFGDESSLYEWKVLAAVRIMELYRHDRGELRRLEVLQDGPSAAKVLHPPGSAPAYRDAGAVDDAVKAGKLVRPPATAPGLRVAAGDQALRPAALKLLRTLGARTASLAHTDAPLTVASTVGTDPTGWSFTLSRRYAAPGQGGALQFVLDRLTTLDAIAWSRTKQAIRVTVAGDVPGL